MKRSKIAPVGSAKVVEAFNKGETVYTVNPSSGWVVCSADFIRRTIAFASAHGETAFNGRAVYGLKKELS